MATELSDGVSLEDLRGQLEGTAKTVLEKGKATGWELSSVDFDSGSYYYDDSGSSAGADNKKTAVSLQSKKKVDGEAYIAFRAYCSSDGTCKINRISFAKQKSKYGIY